MTDRPRHRKLTSVEFARVALSQASRLAFNPGSLTHAIRLARWGVKRLEEERVEQLDRDLQELARARVG